MTRTLSFCDVGAVKLLRPTDRHASIGATSLQQPARRKRVTAPGGIADGVWENNLEDLSGAQLWRPLTKHPDVGMMPVKIVHAAFTTGSHALLEVPGSHPLTASSRPRSW
jgi:hypothetical protein